MKDRENPRKCAAWVTKLSMNLERSALLPSSEQMSSNWRNSSASARVRLWISAFLMAKEAILQSKESSDRCSLPQADALGPGSTSTTIRPACAATFAVSTIELPQAPANILALAGGSWSSSMIYIMRGVEAWGAPYLNP